MASVEGLALLPGDRVRSPSMKLYHRSGAGRPIRVRWALAEVGIEPEVEVLSAQECASAEHARRQPLHRVPVLEDADGPIFESAAILFHIGDLAGDDRLLPAPGTHERALVYQWVLFNMTEIEPPFTEPLQHPEDNEERRASARKQFERALEIVEQALEGGVNLVDGRFTLADLVVSDTLMLGRMMGGLQFSPALEAFVAEHERRPARAVGAELHAS